MQKTKIRTKDRGRNPSALYESLRMNADLFLIAAPKKPNDFFPTSLDDFALTPQGQIGTETLLASPDWTLYALDMAQGKAMLVEMPPDSDLSVAPFVFLDQYKLALRATILDLDAFVVASRAITPPANLSFLFSTGRCGSTLASRIFAQLPEVWSLSEPDYLSNIATVRLKYDRAELVDLLRAATLWTCRPPKGRTQESIIIKTRSEATLIAEFCQQAFPQSRNVFMYRDLIGWANSISKFEQRIEDPALVLSDTEYWRDLWDFLMVGTPISVLEDTFAPDHGPIIGTEFHTLMWDLRIEGYLRALRRGMKFTAIHYTDLNQNRAAETARLLAGCGVSTEHLATAMRAFEQDAHKGSTTANENTAVPLSPERRARAAALLARMGKRDYVETRLPE